MVTGTLKLLPFEGYLWQKVKHDSSAHCPPLDLIVPISKTVQQVAFFPITVMIAHLCGVGFLCKLAPCHENKRTGQVGRRTSSTACSLPGFLIPTMNMAVVEAVLGFILVYFTLF